MKKPCADVGLATGNSEVFKVPAHIQEKVCELWKAPSIDEWLKEQLSDEHKVLYAGIMKARYTATEKFSVEFEALIETLGYVKKDKATLRLERDFEKEVDFIPLLLKEKQSGRGGLNAKNYALTINCAERFSVSAETGKGKEIRDFFVRVFDVIQDYHVLTLQIANKLAVHQARHDALTPKGYQYGHGKHVWYRFWVGSASYVTI